MAKSGAELPALLEICRARWRSVRKNRAIYSENPASPTCTQRRTLGMPNLPSAVCATRSKLEKLITPKSYIASSC